LLISRCIVSEFVPLRFLGMMASLFLVFFGFEWSRVHSNALTRQKRAHFDEVNILETYQPRARTHGHLFQPDPPTPGPNDKKEDGEQSAEKSAFNANRDAHYANMFDFAMKAAKEQEAMEKKPM